MPPRICGQIINLKLAGISQFWLCVQGAADGDEVWVDREDGGRGYWTGTLRFVGSQGAARASVRYNPTRSPRASSRIQRRLRDGDIIDVTITVTNDDGESDPADGQALVTEFRAKGSQKKKK